VSDIHEAADLHLIADRRVAENPLAHAAVGADIDLIADTDSTEMRKEQAVALAILVVGESDPADHGTRTDAAIRPDRASGVNHDTWTDARSRTDAHLVADGRAGGDLGVGMHTGARVDADCRLRWPADRGEQRLHGQDEPRPGILDEDQGLLRGRVQVGAGRSDDDRRPRGADAFRRGRGVAERQRVLVSRSQRRDAADESAASSGEGWTL
jgi:hypothetical protein